MTDRIIAGLRVYPPVGEYSNNWNVFFITLVFLGGLALFTQTQLFVSFLPGPTDQELKNGIHQSVKLQSEIAKETNATPQEKPLSFARFSKTQETELQAAYDFIAADSELEKRFNDRFGTSLKSVKIRVVPAWKLEDEGWEVDTELNQQRGWAEFLELTKSGNAHAMTVREKADGKGRRTLHGTTVVILKHTAITNERTIRFHMFHELVHSMNLPGYKPFPIFGEYDAVLGQTDLAYLAEYRWFTSKAKLSGVESYVCGFFSTLFIGASILATIWLRLSGSVG